MQPVHCFGAQKSQDTHDVQRAAQTLLQLAAFGDQMIRPLKYIIINVDSYYSIYLLQLLIEYDLGKEARVFTLD